MTDPVVEALMQELLGCQWGRKIGSKHPDEGYEPCMKDAVQIVVIHLDENDSRSYKLCERHRDMVFEATTPHGKTE